MSRDKYSANWQTPQLIFSDISFLERLHAGSAKLFDFYYKLETGLGNYSSDLYVKERSLSGTTWSPSSLLKSYADVNEIVSATNSYDGKTHIIYSGPSSVVYRSYNGTSWSSEFTVGDWYKVPRISSSSNDLFVIWRNWDNYIRYRQYDTAPLAPQNLTVSKSAANHPLLSWTKNNEADLHHYQIYKYAYSELGWQLYATSTTNSFEDINETYPIPGGSGLTHDVQYKITTVDLHPYESTFSNVILTTVGGAKLEKQNSGEINPQEYSLNQNYPNPFNPSTKITYSIKEEGLVTLKVYDILGKEITTLVNENKPAGTYEAEFDASQLPSGMYIYKLQAGGFTDVKKMLLTK